MLVIVPPGPCGEGKCVKRPCRNRRKSPFWRPIHNWPAESSANAIGTDPVGTPSASVQVRNVFAARFHESTAFGLSPRRPSQISP